MLEYLHFVPGRLRLKLSELKNQHRAAEARAYLAAVPGVTGVVTNPATGSVTINFDKHLSIDDLWESLRAKDYLSSRSHEFSGTGPSQPADVRAGRLGRTVTAAIFEAVVQHSAHALVRALL